MLVDDTAMEWMRLMEQSERSLIIGGEMPVSCPPSSSHLKPVYLSEQSHWKAEAAKDRGTMVIGEQARPFICLVALELLKHQRCPGAMWQKGSVLFRQSDFVGPFS